jgi:dihydroxy-acid dehydratase
MLMSAARLDLPAVFLYGGSSLPGRYRGKDISIVDVFEGIGAESEGRISADDLLEIERAACPGAGSCAGMFTANTMASVGEAIGMSLPGSATVPAIDPRLSDFARRSGEAVMALLESRVTPRQIMTRPAFENAITTVMGLGGSTNAVLHLLAIANEADVSLDLGDFDRISRKTPHLGDLKPFGRYHMVDLEIWLPRGLSSKLLVSRWTPSRDQPAYLPANNSRSMPCSTMRSLMETLWSSGPRVPKGAQG